MHGTEGFFNFTADISNFKVMFIDHFRVMNSANAFYFFRKVNSKLSKLMLDYIFPFLFNMFNLLLFVFRIRISKLN